MHQKWTLRLSAGVLALAMGIRIAGFGVWQYAARQITGQTAVSLLLYAQTGRIFRPAQTGSTTPAQTENFTNPTQITQPGTTEPVATGAVVSFSAELTELVSVSGNSGYSPDTQALLTKPLELSLYGDGPTVLIMHTHATESYTGDYAPSGSYRTLDTTQNMIAIGEEVARILALHGITAIHDTTLHDYPDYSGAYAAARETVQSYLAQYPDIQLVLDLHRDAAQTSSGQLVTAATVDGQRSAQLMMVVGTDAGGNDHPQWEENLALALKLSVLLEQENPGICRPVNLRSQRFNMDLCAGSLLVEVGAAGNTLPEALIAANALANAVVALANGSE